MNFTKLQGAGNDFVLIETGDMQHDWSKVAAVMCDRHFGVGADGLLLLLPSDVADLRMRIFNADGSEAEACGNGLRCMAKYALSKGIVTNGGQEVSVETITGIRRARLRKKRGSSVIIQVNMGKPVFKAADIPVAIKQDNTNNIVDIKSLLDYPVTIDGEKLLLNFVSTGNPHTVHFWDQPVSGFPLSRLGPIVERFEIFPKHVNFEVVRIINRQKIEARVWEKGVGETLACGSGACAIAVISQLHGYTGTNVEIQLPGGLLEVEWDGGGEVLLSGPAEVVFTGEWNHENIKTG